MRNVIINYGQKTVQAKVVYFGPALSGKTTTIKGLFHELDAKCKITSIETTTGRTLFFDFGRLPFRGKEWDITVNMYATTGQNFYKSTRPATLFGVDAIIFVADAQESLLQYNKESWEELKNYFPDMIKQFPILISLNKYDLPGLASEKEIRNALDLPPENHIEILPSIATQGIGIKAAFNKIMKRMFPNLELNLMH